MSKYAAVFNITWQQSLVYRLNFVLWRVRSVLQLLLVYFIWWTVFQSSDNVFGYTQSSILTYILAAALVRAIILSSRVIDVSGQINQGDIVNFLLKPFDFISFYFFRDFADKLLNISFVIAELALIITLLKPEIIIQSNPVIIIEFLLAVALGIILYFAVFFTLSLTAFWLEEAWTTMFLLSIFLEGFGGGLFPIDILPAPITQFLLMTPFPYLLYFPAKLYLGTMTQTETLKGFVILIFWIIVMWWIMKKVLQAGLRYYTAVGH